LVYDLNECTYLKAFGWVQSMIAEKSIYEHEVEELRQRCEKGCEEVEELRQRLEEVIHVRDRLQEEVQVLARERQNEQQEVRASV
jgi:uncharacterized coiled-coil DUF342 family protein